MNKNVEIALKWGLILGLAVFAAQQFLAVQAQKALPAPADENPPAGRTEPDVQPFCEAFPDDPMCTSFGGPGEAWI
ncbi:hypothetical protein [Oceanithermus sp.]|uniref:hypothetical protein n=1 Tax=Oceanithermus sp. TaxID=2268145 RepID=UPI0025E44EDA|nr:hypothetical protein [Oceanithermus sp.]